MNDKTQTYQKLRQFASAYSVQFRAAAPQPVVSASERVRQHADSAFMWPVRERGDAVLNIIVAKQRPASPGPYVLDCNTLLPAKG